MTSRKPSRPRPRPCETQLASPCRASEPAEGVLVVKRVVKRDPTQRVLECLEAPPFRPLTDGSQTLPTGQESKEAFEQRFNGAVGCKTSETALSLLSEVIVLTCPNFVDLPDDEIDNRMATATAKLGELSSADGTQALVAVQMVGAHTAAMEFLHRALTPGQSVEAVDRNVNRAPD
jgi:hypothetical protein